MKYDKFIKEHYTQDNQLNESSSDQKTIGFDHINGVLKLYLKFQEDEGYDTMKAVAEPNAELKLQFDNGDNGLVYTYQENNYEEDRKSVLEDIRDAADEFDKKVKEILEKRNFIG
jgi:hypothetical protein